MLLSYSTWGMPRVPIEVAVRHCADLGFDGLELTVIPGWSTDAAHLDRAGRSRIRALYDDAGLALCGIAGNVPLLAANPDESRAVMDRFRGYLDLASELQGPGERLSVSTTSGGKSGEWEARRPALVERFGALARHAERTGVVVGAEAHVGSAMSTPEQVLWLVEQVASPSLRVHFDVSHFNVQGMDMDRVISQLAPHSHHTHVKDERGRWPDHVFAIPGEGEMDYVRYLRGMRSAGYDQHITVEVSVMVQARPDYDPLDAAARSYRVLADAFAEAGIERAR